MPPRLRTRRSRRRNVWKVVVAIIVFLGLLVAAAVGVVWLLPMPNYDEVEVADPEIDATPEQIERGRKLVSSACGGCHGSPEDARLRGRALTELPPRWGNITAPNLTKHKSAGLGRVSDGDLVRTLRCGIGADGAFLPPYMPRYDRLADDDVEAIVAFLRSEDPMVASSSSRPGDSRASVWIKLQSRLVWKPKPMPAAPIEAPSRADTLALGAYLVEDVLQCNVCHGSGGDALALDRATADPNYLGGGVALSDVNGKRIYAKNLTFDEDTGIGAWHLEDFQRALVEGRREDGTLLRWPMRRYPMLDDVEVSAIFSYLANVPQVVRELPEVEPYPIPGGRLDRGRHLFFKQECFACHGEKAPHGILATAAEDFEDDAAVAEFLRNPSATRPGTQMPSFALLDEADLLSLGTYVRSVAPK